MKTMNKENVDEQHSTLPACRKSSAVVPADKKHPPISEAISDLTCRNLIHAAKEAMGKAYAPYSGFRVGAALLAKNKKVYSGCNIENAAYGPSNCAERTAIFKAVSEGVKDFLAIAIVGGKEGNITDLCPPCGVCRQVMAEFCKTDEFYVILARSEEDYWIYTLEELLPMGFGAANLTR